MAAPGPESNDERTVINPSAARSQFGVGSSLINGTYVVEGFLARGGMGEVYRARHIDHGTQHAIKVILPELADDPTVLQLFIREARELGRIQSDAIVRYQGFLRDERGARCLVMEFVDGDPLRAILSRSVFAPSEVLALLERIGEGLAAAHELGIVHRDISPENIILPGGRIERAKLIDFGIAKSTDGGDRTLIGTDFAGKYSWVSPEQVGLYGGAVDARSDIYSLGLVLAAAALGHGRKLDMGASLAGIAQVRQAVPDLGAIPAVLRPLVQHMLQPRPEDRPASIRAVLDEIPNPSRPPTASRPAAREHAASGRSRSNTRSTTGRATPATAPGQTTPTRRRRGMLAAGLAVAAAGGIAALVYLLLPQPPPSVEQLQEQVAAATTGYQCARFQTVLVRDDRSVAIAGHVATDEDLGKVRDEVGKIRGITRLDFDVRRRPRPYCDLAELLKSYLAENSQVPAVALGAASSEPAVGRRLVIDLQAPRFDSYVYVDYFDGSGEVTHLFPNNHLPIALRPARNRFALGRAPMPGCWTFTGPPGEQLITFVASERRLFRSPPRTSENANDYVARLSEALSVTGGQKHAAILFFGLGPGVPAEKTGLGCAGG